MHYEVNNITLYVSIVHAKASRLRRNKITGMLTSGERKDKNVLGKKYKTRNVAQL